MQDVSFKLTPAVLEILDRLILPPNLPCIHVGMLVGCLVDFYRIARVFLLQVGGKAMHELDYSSRSLMQLCKTRHPLCSIPRGYLIASALLP